MTSTQGLLKSPSAKASTYLPGKMGWAI